MLNEIDVMILAAGLGTRLRPLTEHTPKPLVRLGGKALIEYHLERLSQIGIRRVIINLHYLPKMIRDNIGDGSRWNLEIVYSEEPVILGTGGGVKNIESELLTNNLLIINSDSFFACDLDIKDFIDCHLYHKFSPDLTLMLKETPEAKKYGEFGINEDGKIVKFLDTQYARGEYKDNLMYVGILIMKRHVISDYMPDKGSIFSLTKDTLKKLLTLNKSVYSYLYTGYFSDIGTIERLNEVELYLKNQSVIS